MKNIFKIILFFLAINIGYSQSTRITTTTLGQLQDSLVAVNSNKSARYIPFSVLKDRLFSAQSRINLDTLGFNIGGYLTWNTDDFTINVDTGLGPILQVGQELYTVFYNNSGAQIDNSKAVYPIGSFNGRPSIEKAIANT